MVPMKGHHQPGRQDFRGRFNYAERLCERRVLGFLDWLGWNRDGKFFQRAEGQCRALALANVVNLQGLKNLGNGDYETTLASGTATVGISGAAGLGTMVGGALEASNVNISAEFSNLIIAQRAFEANSKAITAFDTVTQETINMIH